MSDHHHFSEEGFARLFEGEGSIFNTQRHSYTQKPSLTIRIAMTDQDVIEAVHTQYGGSVCGMERRDRPQNKPIYQWALQGPAALALAEASYPWLFSRRKGQVELAVVEYVTSRRLQTSIPITAYRYDPELRTFRRGCERSGE